MRHFTSVENEFKFLEETCATLVRQKLTGMNDNFCMAYKMKLIFIISSLA